MTDKKKSRRKLLKSVAAGGGAIVAAKSVSETWSKPIISSVILPAHAEASPTTTAAPTTTGAATTSAPTTPSPTTQPPTTPPCCLVDATYCYLFFQGAGALEITVSATGSISVELDTGDGLFMFSDVIYCRGGSFNVGNADHTITGTVSCGASTITGSLTVWGTLVDANYTATLGACPARGGD